MALSDALEPIYYPTRGPIAWAGHSGNARDGLPASGSYSIATSPVRANWPSVHPLIFLPYICAL